MGKRKGLGFLYNISKDNKRVVLEAAKKTGYDIYTEEIAYRRDGDVLPDCIAVYARKPHMDHLPMWTEYHKVMDSLVKRKEMEWK